MRRLPLLLALAALPACSDVTHCDPQPQVALAQLPEAFSQTGLYTEEGARPYAPRFELWSDGASKRRFVRLPPGAQIDISDPDDWQLPTGTKLWKEFTRDGVRVETRILFKWGPAADAWVARAYLWSEDGIRAFAADSGRTNALGTDHDVPSNAQCFACHGGRKSRALGFSYLQLAYAADSSNLSLAELELPLAARVDLPGSERTQQGLGYLHANCGHCHNQARPEHDGARCYDPDNPLDLWLRVGQLDSVADTSIRRSAEPADWLSGHSELSRMLKLMARRGPELHMPPLASERADQAGLAAVRDLIDGR